MKKYLISGSLVLIIVLLSAIIGLNIKQNLKGYAGPYRNIEDEIVFEAVDENILPDGNNNRDLGAFGYAFNNLFVSSTSYLNYVSSTAIDISDYLIVSGNITLGDATSDTITPTGRFAADLDPSSNNAIDLGVYGLAFKDIFVSGTLHANVVESNNAHIHLIVTTTQTIVAANTPQEVYWDEISAEHQDFGVTDGVSSPTTTIPVDGSYSFRPCLEVEKTTGGQIEKFEMALYVDSVLEPSSAVVEDFKDNNMVTKVCVDDVIDAMTTGEEVTIKMAGESTNFRVAPTSTIFAGADVSGGGFVITQLDGD